MKKKKRLLIIVSGIALIAAIVASLYFFHFRSKTGDGEVNKVRSLLKFAENNLNNSPQKALEYANNAVDLSKELKQKELEIEARIMVGKANMRTGYFDEAYSELNRAMAISLILKNTKYQADINYNMGNIELYRGNYDRCIEHYERALELYRELNDKQGEANATKWIGDLNINIGNYSKALDNQLRSIELYEKIDDKRGMGAAYISVSNTFYELGKLDEALDNLLKAKDIFLDLNQTAALGVIFNNLGEIEEARTNYEQALIYHKQSLEIEEKSGNLEGIGEAYNNIGEIYLKQNQYDKANNYFNEAIDIFKRRNMKPSLNNAIINRAELYLLTGETKKAENELLAALKDISAEDYLIKSKLYSNLKKIYTNQKNYEKALFYANKLHTVKDTLQKEQFNNKMLQMQMTYNIRTKNEILEDEKFKRRIFIIGVSVILLIVLSFSFILLRKNYEINRVNVKLSHQNQEILDAEEELQQANQELAKNVDRLKLIVQNIPVLINAVDDNGDFVFWNKECEIVTGYDADEIIHNPSALNMLYPDPQIRKEINEGFHVHKDYRNIQTKINCKNGETKIISWSNVSESVPIPGWLEWNIGVDITKQHNFENNLVQEKSLLNSLLNSIPDLIFYKDNDGKYLGCNPAFANFYNIESDLIIKKEDHEVFDAQLADFFVETDKEVLEARKSQKYEKWVERDGENEILLETIKTPFFNADGDIIGLVGVSRDMTERYRVQEQMKQAKEKAENADRLKSAFLSNMSHEIRTPMNAIVGFSNLLSSPDTTDDERDEYISYINNSSNNLLTLIDDIIDTAKIEAGEVKIQKTSIGINQTLKELHATYIELRKEREKHDIEIVLKCERPNNFEANTDPNRLRQILNNLVSNAMKFTDKGYIEFGYNIRKIDDTNKHRVKVDECKKDLFIEFYVKDTGIGIPEEKMDDIFTRFGQVHQVSSRNVGGTGLGLTISKNLVELLGGTIWVESQQGRGSLFRFTIPYQLQKQENENKTENIVENPSTNTGRIPDWSMNTLLIAEDERMNIKLIEIALRPTKATIIHAKDGAVAVELFKKHIKDGIDLVLLDIQMPNKNGYEAMQEIREIDERIPIVAQTAFALADEKLTTIEAGFNGYISKPIKKEELFAVLKRYLG